MIYKYILLFFIYSFFGWIIEVIVSLCKSHKLVNRGFFIGLYCPIYGCGALSMVFFLQKYIDDLTALFFMSIVICATLEYFTGFIMEKLFHARWWDYSEYKFNINGRICLETMIPFGLIGCLVVHYLNPALCNIIDIMPILLVKILSILLIAFFVIDNILSFGIIANIDKLNININPKKDSTEEITKKVKEILVNKNFLTKRLIDAFPDLEFLKRMTIDKIKLTKREIKVTQRKIKKMQKEVNKKEKKLNKISRG